MPAACRLCLYIVRLPEEDFKRFPPAGVCSRCGLARSIRVAARRRMVTRDKGRA